jgi:hypothetical protein
MFEGSFPVSCSTNTLPLKWAFSISTGGELMEIALVLHCPSTVSEPLGRNVKEKGLQWLAGMQQVELVTLASVTMRLDFLEPKA